MHGRAGCPLPDASGVQGFRLAFRPDSDQASERILGLTDRALDPRPPSVDRHQHEAKIMAHCSVSVVLLLLGLHLSTADAQSALAPAAPWTMIGVDLCLVPACSLNAGSSCYASAPTLSFNQSCTYGYSWAPYSDGTVRNALFGGCLAIKGSSGNYPMSSGDFLVTLQACTGAVEQKWYLPTTSTGGAVRSAVGYNGQDMCLMGTQVIGTGNQMFMPAGAGSCVSVYASVNITVALGAQVWPQTVFTVTALANTNTNSCLDAPNASGGSFLQSFACSNASSQVWVYRSDGSLHNSASDLCMDVWQAGTADGTTIDSYRCNGTPAQSWTVAFLSVSKVQFVNPNSGKCLDSRAGTNGAAMQLYTCTNSTASQLFQLTDSAATALTATAPGSLPLWTSSVPSTAFAVNGLFSNNQDSSIKWCLDIHSDSTAALLGISRCNSTIATQTWSYRLDGSLYNPAKDLCVDMLQRSLTIRGVTTPDDVLVVVPCNGSSTQAWTVSILSATGTLAQFVNTVDKRQCLDMHAIIALRTGSCYTTSSSDISYTQFDLGAAATSMLTNTPPGSLPLWTRPPPSPPPSPPLPSSPPPPPLSPPAPISPSTRPSTTVGIVVAVVVTVVLCCCIGLCVRYCCCRQRFENKQPTSVAQPTRRARPAVPGGAVRMNSQSGRPPAPPSGVRSTACAGCGATPLKLKRCKGSCGGSGAQGKFCSRECFTKSWEAHSQKTGCRRIEASSAADAPSRQRGRSAPSAQRFQTDVYA